MELGVFSLADVKPDSGDTVISRIGDIIDWGRLTERYGLDVFGVGEHHTAMNAVSSPAVVLAAIAQATSRIRLTTTATVLSVLDPVPVYQDFATLDLISHGRAELTAGRSAFAEPFALFGEDASRYDQLFAERLELLLRIRADEPVNWTGRVRPPLRETVVPPRATSRLPVWVAVGGTPASAERAGTLGLPMMLGLIGGTIHQAQRLVDLYRAAGARAGHAPETLSLGITSHFFVGENAASARDDFFPYYQRYLSPETNGGRGWHVDRAGMEHLAGPRGALMVGSAEEVAAKVLDMRATLGVDRFLGQVDLGGMPRQMVHDSIRRFGEIVAPAVRHVLGD